MITLRKRATREEMDISSICHFNIHMRCFELFQGQANANDWVAEAVKDVNMMGRSSSSGMSPVGGDSETAVTLLPILQAQRERFRFISASKYF